MAGRRGMSGPAGEPPRGAARGSPRRAIEAGAAAAGVALSAHALAGLERYLDLVVEWNARIRLTGAASRLDVSRVLVADGLEVLPAIRGAQAVADLGSGAGVPGVLIALLCPAVRVVLVEASRKKAGFLEIVLRELALPNAEVVCARAETLGQDPAHRSRYDAVTARAVADLRVLLEYALPLLRVGGVAVLPKGRSAARELTAAAHALDALGGAAELRGGGAGLSSLVVVRKIRPTPDAYPRRAGVPERRPIA